MNKLIVVFDVESTGLDKTKDHIIQFSGMRVDPSTLEIVDTLNLFIKPSVPYSMSLGAYFKHKIKPADLENCPTFADVADQITEFIGTNDILVYNGVSFDIPMLRNEYARCGKVGPNFGLLNIYDSFLEEKRRNGNRLSETFERYAGQTMEQQGLKPHDAFSDIKATLFVFAKQQMNKEFAPEELIGEGDMLEMMDFCGVIQPCFKIGKYRGVALEYVMKKDSQYINWCLSDKASFGPVSKDFLGRYIAESQQ